MISLRVPLTLAIHEAGCATAAHIGYRLYDGCATLFSEDLQNGHVVDGRLTISNPFATPA